MKRILIIEDDREIARLIQLYLEQTGQYEVAVTHSAEAALMLLDTQQLQRAGSRRQCR